MFSFWTCWDISKRSFKLRRETPQVSGYTSAFTAWLRRTWHHTANHDDAVLVSSMCDPPCLANSTFLARRLTTGSEVSLSMDHAVVWNPIQSNPIQYSFNKNWQNAVSTKRRSPDISLDVFKARLKTFLFNCWLSAFGVFYSNFALYKCQL